MLQNYNVSNGTKLPAKITYCKYQSVDANPSGDPTVRVFIDGFSAGTMSPGESFEIPYAIGELRFETVDPALRAIFRAGIVRVLSTVQTIDGTVTVSGTIEESALAGREYGTDTNPFAINTGGTQPKPFGIGVINQTAQTQKLRKLELSVNRACSEVEVLVVGFASIVDTIDTFFAEAFNKLTGARYFPGNGNVQNDMRPFVFNGSAGAISSLFIGLDQKGVLRYVGNTAVDEKISYVSDGSIFVPPDHAVLIFGKCDPGASNGTASGVIEYTK